MSEKMHVQLVYIDIDFPGSLFSRRSLEELQRIATALKAATPHAMIVLSPQIDQSDYHLHWLEELQNLSRQEFLEQCRTSLEWIHLIRSYADRLIFLSRVRCIGSINVLAAACGVRILTKPGLQYGCDEFESGFFLPTEYKKRRRVGANQQFELVETKRDFAGSKSMHSQWLLLESQDYRDENISQVVLEQRKNSTLLDSRFSQVKLELDTQPQVKTDANETAAELVDQFMSSEYQDFLVKCICHAPPLLIVEKTPPSFVFVNVTTDHLPFRFITRNLFAGSFVVLKANHHDDLLRYMNLAAYQLTQSYQQELAEALWFHRMASVVTDHINERHMQCSLSNEGQFQILLNKNEFNFYYLGSTKQGSLVLEDYLGFFQKDLLPDQVKNFLALHCISLTNPIIKIEDLQATPFAKVVRFLMLVEMQRMRQKEGITFHDIMEAFEKNNEQKKTIRMSWTRTIQQLDKDFMQSALLKRCAEYLDIDVPSLTQVKELIDLRSSSFIPVHKKQEWTPTFIVRHLQTWARLVISQFNQVNPLNFPESLRGQFFYWSTGLFDPSTALWYPSTNSMEGPSLFHGRKYWPFLPGLGRKDFGANGFFHHKN